MGEDIEGTPEVEGVRVRAIGRLAYPGFSGRAARATADEQTCSRRRLSVDLPDEDGRQFAGAGILGARWT
jgi:hypothetical protein